MIEPMLKAAVLRAARDIRLAEFTFSQELMEHDLTVLTDAELESLEKHVSIATKFGYEIGLNAFTGERWKRERLAIEPAPEKTELELLTSQALEETL